MAQIGITLVLTIVIRTSNQLARETTVEPPNKGHFGSGDFVLYLEAVLWWEVGITIVSTRVIPIGAIASVLHIEVVLWWELHCTLNAHKL